MIARVSLEIALRKEFDYSIPAELAGQVDVGSRVQVPFGARKILGVVTAVAEESAHTNLKPILKVIGAQTLVTEKFFALARWIGEYYCCAPETALKSVLPEAVRSEDSSWRERLFVRLRPGAGEYTEIIQTPAGGLEHRRGAPRDFIVRARRAGRNHRRAPCASSRTAGSSKSPRKFRSATLMRANTSCPRNHWC